jgi:S-adenosylmethionine:tRNA ribosyltransferase-isomerase
VIPARLIGTKSGGGRAELLLVRGRSDGLWEVLAKPGRRLKPGAKMVFGETLSCEVVDLLPDGQRVVRFDCAGTFEEELEKYGQMPLPGYLGREQDDSLDPDSYQTVYAQNPGAIAAPTAGLHFTPALLDNLEKKQVDQIHVTLHVGMGTFKPVQVDDIREHAMHTERAIISPEVADKLNRSAAGKQICVGTTTCRTLESAAQKGMIHPGEFETDIFIYPGYQFRQVKHLLTNFHLPGSTLLMLVSAFGGYELIREAYVYAVKNRFRFFSYGDAMLII